MKLEFVLHDVVISQSKRLFIECQSFFLRLYILVLASFWDMWKIGGHISSLRLITTFNEMCFDHYCQCHEDYHCQCDVMTTLRDFYERGQKKKRVEKVKPTLHFITSWKRPKKQRSSESSFNFGQSFLLLSFLVLLLSGICLVRLRTFSTLRTDFYQFFSQK